MTSEANCGFNPDPVSYETRPKYPGLGFLENGVCLGCPVNEISTDTRVISIIDGHLILCVKLIDENQLENILRDNIGFQGVGE